MMAMAEIARQGAFDSVPQSGPESASNAASVATSKADGTNEPATVSAAVPLPAVAEAQSLPLAYLEQLFGALRRAELVTSNRGRSGGYRLARAPSEISVAAIMSAVDEATAFTRCTDERKGCTPTGRCITHGLWQALGDVTARFLEDVTLADIVDGRFADADANANGAALGDASNATASSGAGSKPRVYLDHNATSPVRTPVAVAMREALDLAGNPSSVHRDGRDARRILETARESVAALVNCTPSEVVFTSGATEAVTWAMAQPWRAIITSAVEHDCVLANATAAHGDHHLVAINGDGQIDLKALERVLVETGGGADVLLSVQAANNETGVIQPLSDIAALARGHGVRIHCDAAQAPGRMAIDFAGLDLDLLSLSAHKFGGPKGTGALIVRDHYDLVPLLKGGGQERRRRAGTENIAGIAGFGAAARLAMNDSANADQVRALRDKLEAAVIAAVPATRIVAQTAPRLVNTSAIALPGQLAETLVIRLDLDGIAVSAGSACSSGKVGASHVLAAMGLADDIARGTVRVSLSPETTDEDIDALVAAWRGIAQRSQLAA